jgi:hypothetical protein
LHAQIALASPCPHQIMTALPMGLWTAESGHRARLPPVPRVDWYLLRFDRPGRPNRFERQTQAGLGQNAGLRFDEFEDWRRIALLSPRRIQDRVGRSRMVPGHVPHGAQNAGGLSGGHTSTPPGPSGSFRHNAGKASSLYRARIEPEHGRGNHRGQERFQLCVLTRARAKFTELNNS